MFAISLRNVTVFSLYGFLQIYMTDLLVKPFIRKRFFAFFCNDDFSIHCHQSIVLLFAYILLYFTSFFPFSSLFFSLFSLFVIIFIYFVSSPPLPHSGVTCSSVETLRDEYPGVAMPVWAFTEPYTNERTLHQQDYFDNI